MSNTDDFWENEAMSEEEAENIKNGNYIEEDYDDETDFMEVYEDEYEDNEEQALATKQESVMQNALIRLEQGRLYKMIMDHLDDGMFVDTGCDERSINNVEREMRAFIMSRLEVLLGVRQKKPKKVQVLEKPTSQLNDIELAVIRKISANAMSKAGVSSPIKKINSSVSQPIKKVSKPSNSAPSKPVSNSKPKQQPKHKPAPKKQSNKKPVNKKLSNKSPFQMTPEELIERNKQITNKSSARPIPNSDNPPLPPPTGDQLETYYSNQTDRGGSPEQNSLVNAILKSLK